MPYVNTTFLPKTNGMVFADRMIARSNKGRIPGLGKKLTLKYGVSWVTAEPFLVSEDVVARTASWDNIESGDVFRYRLQTRPAGDTTITNGGWTSYDGTGQDVTVTLPADDTLEVRFHSQGKDQSNDNVAINSFTAWRALSTPTP